MTQTADCSYNHAASRIHIQVLDIPAIEDSLRPLTHRRKFINPLLLVLPLFHDINKVLQYTTGDLL